MMAATTEMVCLDMTSSYSVRAGMSPFFSMLGVLFFCRLPTLSLIRLLVVVLLARPWPVAPGPVAVITESGGPLSHGAVTAREVGIPAVMSVRGALSALQDGERVRVNGSTGTVTRLGEAISSSPP
jgi:hypothetical protein